MAGRADDIIRIKLVLDTSDLRRKVKVTTEEVRHIKRAVQDTNRSLSGMVSLFSLIAAGAGFIRITSGIISLNAETQNAKASMATLYDALTDASIMDGSAIAIANQQFSELRKNAAVGVGETKDWLEVYSKLLAPGISLGLDGKEMINLTRQTITAGFAIRGKEGMKLAAMDIPQALGGAANEKVTPIAMRIIEATGKTAKEFNALGREDRMKTLMEGFAKFEAGAELMGKTFEAQSSTTKDILKLITETATKPIFDLWTDQLVSLNEWLAANMDKILSVSKQWGANMVEYWKAINANAKSYLSILSAALALSTSQGVSRRMSVGGVSFVSHGKKAPVGLVGGVTPLVGQAMFGAAGGVGASGSVAAASAAPLSLSVVAAGIAVIAALAVAVGSFMGGMEDYPAITGMALTAIKQVGIELVELANTFGFLFAEGSILNMWGVSLVGLLGVLAGAVVIVVKVISTFVLALSAMVTEIGNAILTMAENSGFSWLLKKMGAKTGDERRSASGRAGSYADQFSAIWFGRVGQVAADEKKKDPKSSKKEVTNTNINVQNMQINVKAEVNEDPVRIASAFEEVIDKMQRHRLQPRRLLGPSLG